LKILLVIDHAPDYRETFFRELGRQVDLTVVAQPCEPDGLAAPDKRLDYRYIEIHTTRFMGFFWQPGLGKLLHKGHWDVVCFDINLRHVARLLLFLKNSSYWNKWVWRGLIFGQNSLKIIGAIRKFLIKRAAACLVYSEEVARRVKYEYGAEAISFNNTEVKRDEFRPGKFNADHEGIKMIFVGTCKPRKKLERLIKLVERRTDVKIRLIGPGMESLVIPEGLKDTGRLKIFGRTTGEKLNLHFDWADLVVSPGNVGLLVMNAARHEKGIVVDNNSYHGPEHWLAKEAGQPFISFGDQEEVDRFIEDVLENRWKLKHWGQQLQDLARKRYTIEYMAEAHFKVFERIIPG